MTTEQQLCRAHPDDCPNGPEPHAYYNPPEFEGRMCCCRQPGEEAPAPEEAAAPLAAEWKAEIAAMGNAYNALKRLDRMAQLRATRWLNERLLDDARQAAGDDEEPF